MQPLQPTESILYDDWYVIGSLENLPVGSSSTRLFGHRIDLLRSPQGDVQAQTHSNQRHIETVEKYGFIWACLGSPARDIPFFPEAFDSKRYQVQGGAIRVKTSGLRMVENFLDLGHLPFVHTGWLGEQPHTEVAPYKVEITDDNEILATDCVFYQPIASPSANTGVMADYMYRVFRPFCVALYKTNPAVADSKDFIALLIQPTDHEEAIAHPLLCYFKEGMDTGTLRWFMQLIFAQDKPILENQVPKRLPLDPRAETPIRADAAAILYRRWLTEQGVCYGAIPA